MSEKMKKYGLFRKYVIFKLPDPDEQTAFTNRAIDEIADTLAQRFTRSQIEPVDVPAFVLTPTKDVMSRVALAAYAKQAREQGYEMLADDLEQLLEDTEIGGDA